MNRNNLLILLLVLLATFFAFFPALKNDFVNWDDKVYLHYSPLIKNLSLEYTVEYLYPENLKK